MNRSLRRFLRSLTLSALLIALLLPVFSGCSSAPAVTTDTVIVIVTGSEKKTDTVPESTTAADKKNEDAFVEPQFTFPEGETEFVIHSKEQEEYLLGDYRKISSYADGTQEKSHPRAVVLTWGVDKESRKFIRNYHVLVSESPEMTDPVDIMSREERASVYNLKTGTSYYWTVVANCGDENYTSEVRSFSVDALGPRNLKVDGVTNFRDLGGWQTEDGGRVRQGLIYRCARLSENYTGTTKITAAGKKFMLETLKVRTEIDLRGATVGEKGMESGNLKESPLGSSVNYQLLPIYYNDGINPAAEKIREIFALLAKEENYPVFFHCSIGTDRTGKLAFLINALLGVSETDLYTDYLFSNFGKIGSSRNVESISSSYVREIKRAPGDTLSEKTYNYLVGVGVPAADLDALISIMKEPAK